MNKDIFVLVFQAYVIRGVTDTMHLILLYSTKTCVCILHLLYTSNIFHSFSISGKVLKRNISKVTLSIYYKKTFWGKHSFLISFLFLIMLLSFSNRIIPFDTNITGFWYIIHFLFTSWNIFLQRFLTSFHRWS